MAVKLISWRGRELKHEDWSELVRCRCPNCRRRRSEGLKESWVEGFAHRALHHLRTLLEESALIDEHSGRDDFPGWSSRARGNRMADRVALALDLPP